MSGYKAVLFSPDGEWVTDCRAATVQGVWERVDDLGSKWFFYPIPFVIVDHGPTTTDRQRIVAVPEAPLVLTPMLNRSIRSIARELRENPDLGAILTAW